jgi:fatty acid synthase subunit alpha, fungi type
MRYLKRNSRSGKIAFDKEKVNSLALQARLDSIAKEHGDTYIDGIQPIFDPLKARRFDSSWNLARQDALLMYYDRFEVIGMKVRRVNDWNAMSSLTQSLWAV